MAQPLGTDELWSIIEPHLPVKPRRKRNPGRLPTPDRACLAGILFVLRSGIPWEMLPQEMGCGCGMTCWRRLRDWKKAGVWQTIHQVLLDSATVRAVGGAKRPAPAPSIAENPAANTTS